MWGGGEHDRPLACPLATTDAHCIHTGDINGDGNHYQFTKTYKSDLATVNF